MIKFDNDRIKAAYPFNVVKRICLTKHYGIEVVIETSSETHTLRSISFVNEDSPYGKQQEQQAEANRQYEQAIWELENWEIMKAQNN